MRRGCGKLLGDLDIEPCLTQFARSVSGLFFQLLAAMGEKMIAESCRSAALPPPELGFQPWSWSHWRLSRPSARGPLVWKNSPGPRPWPQGQKARESLEVKATVRDFLSHNPDLAEDWRRCRWCSSPLKLREHQPEYVGLSFRGQAGTSRPTGRSFLDQSLRPCD